MYMMTAATMNKVFNFSLMSLMKRPYRNVLGPAFLLTRNIYGDNYLNIENYVHLREKYGTQFRGIKDKFTARMEHYVNSSTQDMIFTDDLKHMVHLADNNPGEIDLLIAMMKKFNKQNTDLRFDSYIFGPVVMRLLHYLDIPDVAYGVIKDPELVNFFDQIMSYTIAMNLLYKHGKYSQVLELNDILIERQFSTTRFPRDATVLTLAACYQLNTEESFKYAVKLLQDVKEVSATVLRKGVTFAAGLAIKQNRPAHALEILNLTSQVNYLTVKNLKVIALVQMDRFDDAFIVIRNAIERDVPETAKRVADFTEETIAIVKDAIQQSQNKEQMLQFERMVQALREGNLLTNSTIDEVLCTPTLQRPPQRTRDSRIVGFESQFFEPPIDRRYGRQPNQNWPLRHRQGLMDSDE